MRSWTFDSELSCAVVDEAGAYPRDLRLALAREHLDRAAGDDGDLRDPVEAFEAFRRAAKELDAWHAGGRRGTRPPGRLRGYPWPELGPVTAALAERLYRYVYDPDGRPTDLRRANTF